MGCALILRYNRVQYLADNQQSYSPGSRKLVYEKYNPLLGPPSREKTPIPKMYRSWVLLLVREFDENTELRKTFIRINSPLILQALKSSIKSKRASFERSEFPWPNEDIFRSVSLVGRDYSTDHELDY